MASNPSDQHGTSGDDTIEGPRDKWFNGRAWVYDLWIYVNGEETYAERTRSTQPKELSVYTYDGDDTIDFSTRAYKIEAFAGDGDDYLKGKGKLYGEGGNDYLIGIGELHGGKGDDYIVAFRYGGDYDHHTELYGGAGFDTVDFSGFNRDIEFTFAGDTQQISNYNKYTWDDSFENFIGGSGDDTVTLTKSKGHVVSTGEGDDIVYGAAGDDFIDVGDINTGDQDIVYFGGGWNTLYMGDVGTPQEWYQQDPTDLSLWVQFGLEKPESSGSGGGGSSFELTWEMGLELATLAPIVGKAVKLGTLIADWLTDNTVKAEVPDDIDAPSFAKLMDFDPRYDQVILPVLSFDQVVANVSEDDWLRLELDAGGAFLELHFDSDFMSTYRSVLGIHSGVDTETIAQSLWRSLWSARVQFSKDSGGTTTVFQGSAEITSANFNEAYTTVDAILEDNEHMNIFGNVAGYNVNINDAERFVAGSAFDDYITTESLGSTDARYMAGFDGNDTLKVGHASHTIVFDGGDGFDALSFEGMITGATSELYTGGVTVELGTSGGQSFTSESSGSVISSVEAVFGTDYDDTLTGNTADNLLVGNDGADTIAGRGGDDLLDGGKGDDRVKGGDGDDHIRLGRGSDFADGGDGTDTADFSDSGLAWIKLDLSDNSIAEAWFADGWATEVKQARGLAPFNQSISFAYIDNIENVIGTDGNDEITGDANDNVIDGGDGDDILDGGDGDDYLDGGAGANVIYGGKGADTIRVADDSIYNVLEGGNGRDDIRGGDGVDIITGGKHDDELYGMGGDDDFIFEQDGSTDTVRDFELGDSLMLVGVTEADDWSMTYESAIGGMRIITYDGTTVDLRDTGDLGTSFFQTEEYSADGLLLA